MQSSALNVFKMSRFDARAGVLTERQERAFRLVFQGGFFDYYGKINTVELALKAGT
jgi:predicted DNA binding protein